MVHLLEEITQGTILTRREAEGMRFTETLHQPGTRLTTHAHRTASLNFVLQGSYVEELEGSSREIVSGDLLVKPAGCIHADHYGRGAVRSLIIDVSEEEVKCQGLGATLLEPARIERPRATRILFEMIRTELIGTRPGSDLLLRGLFLQILGELTGASASSSRRRPPGWLDEVRDQIQRSFVEPVRLSDLAERMGRHPGYMTRAFRRQYGMTPGAFVRELRLREGFRLLSHPELSIAEVAMAAGFADQSHFSRCFRQRFGITPSARRRSSEAAEDLSAKVRCVPERFEPL